MDPDALDLGRFIDASPSPFHAVAEAATRLEAAGFTTLDEREPWAAATGRRYVVRDGSLVAWRVDDGTDPGAPWRMVGAHTDSPNLRVKPRPDIGGSGTRQLGVEVYGGPLLNSWLDRDLGLAGRVALRGGDLRLLRLDRPALRIPQLAIHLDREIVTNGLSLNPQQHLAPIWGLGGPEPDGFRSAVAAAVGVAPGDVLSWELGTFDLAPSALVGDGDALLSAARLDNLCSCWAAVGALAADPAPSGPALVALFDHEEVGSTSSRGASGPLVAAVLERVVAGLGGGDDARRRALAGSLLASADMAHATHPNYPERHDPAHTVRLGGGPVVKVNASQRYATDARTAAAFIEACERAGVGWQQFVSRNDMPCGSTIGPLSAAALGIATVDVGAPQLAMHSARELMAAADVGPYREALAAFLRP